MPRQVGPRVIHKRSAKGGDDEVYIGRPSEFGNPFTIGPDGMRAEVIEKYEDYLLASPDLMEKVRHQLKGKVLVCWCRPELCHGDVLLKYANPELNDPPVQASLW